MNQIKPNDTSRIFNSVVSVFASGLTLGGIALGGWYIMYYRNHEQTNNAQIEQYVTPVMSRVTGYVKVVKYQDNSFVHKGDTLIQLDEREYRAKLDMAYADFENALKNLPEMKSFTSKNEVKTSLAVDLDKLSSIIDKMPEISDPFVAVNKFSDPLAKAYSAYLTFLKNFI